METVGWKRGGDISNFINDNIDGSYPIQRAYPKAIKRKFPTETFRIGYRRGRLRYAA